MIANRGAEWRGLDDKIYLRGRRIVAVYRGDVRFYPAGTEASSAAAEGTAESAGTEGGAGAGQAGG